IIAYSGRRMSNSTLRSASPDSNSPVHCMTTSGLWPPRCKPAAIAQASPSRQTRTNVKSGDWPSAASHAPSVESGSQTTCVTSNSAIAAAICGPVSTLSPFFPRTGGACLFVRACLFDRLERRDPEQRLARFVDPPFAFQIGLVQGLIQDNRVGQLRRRQFDLRLLRVDAAPR